MAMSRVDYEKMARLFKGRCGQSYVDNNTVAVLVADFCNMASAANPRFNVEKFIEAAVTPEIEPLITRVKSMFGGTTCYPAETIWR